LMPRLHSTDDTDQGLKGVPRVCSDAQVCRFASAVVKFTTCASYV
jgi:hypothetical protein